MALRDVLVFFGVEVDQKPLDDTQKKTDNLLATFRNGARVLQAFGAALVTSALTRFITDTVAAADDIGDLAARLGVTTDEFQVLKAVADDVGTSVGSIQSGFRSLAEKMKSGSAEFGKLGVQTRNADGSLRSVTDVFWDVGTALGDTADQATRLQLTQELLGRGGLQLLPVFAGGAEAVAAYREQISETAVVFDAAFIEKSDAASKHIQAFQNKLARVRALLVAQLLPAFEWALSVLSKAATYLQKFVQSGRALQTFLSAGTALLLRWAGGVNLGAMWVQRLLPLVRSLWRFLLRFALPVLIIDELITLFRGGDTLIGRFIDKLFGIGAAAKFVEGVTTVVRSLIDTIASLFSGTDDWEMAFLKASDGIGKVFDGLFEWIGRGFDRLLIWIGEQIVALVRKLPGGELIFGKAGTEFDPEGNAQRGAALAAGQLPASVPSIAPQPALSDAAARRAVADSGPGAAPQVTNNITVEGNATPAVAREIATRTGAATGAAVGRDRAAIGRAVGVGS
jgi:hypothetical protein